MSTCDRRVSIFAFTSSSKVWIARDKLRQYMDLGVQHGPVTLPHSHDVMYVVKALTHSKMLEARRKILTSGIGQSGLFVITKSYSSPAHVFTDRFLLSTSLQKTTLVVICAVF